MTPCEDKANIVTEVPVPEGPRARSPIHHTNAAHAERWE